jgi:hypothetical protein
MAANYGALGSNNNPSPYGSGDPYYSQSTGYITPHQPVKKRISNWIKIGIPLSFIVVVAVVLGVVFGIRKSHTNGSAQQSSGGAAAASSAASAKLAVGRFATATDSEFMVPIYPSTTNTAVFTTPTFISSTSSKLAWPQDAFQPSNPDVHTPRPDRPRLIAPAYKWQALPTLIQNDPYLKGWNDTIFGNATDYFGLPPVVYFMDGDSGILDNARDVKRRIKAFAYVYRMTNDTKWVDRAWAELQNAAGNGTTSFGPATDKWNNGHFLDTAEFSAAFGIAYDWLYDMWTDEQKSQIRSTLILYGLQPGLAVFNGGTTYGWWSNNITGNWNCVCNGGLTLASLAILGDDTTGIASQLLSFTVDNAKQNCANAVVDDGTWTETANYWYFGTTGHSEMSSALFTATGSDYGLLDVNSNFFRTGQFHMYAFGATSLFNYGDHGPNKYSTTANSMFLYADHYKQPSYALFQREQSDAAEPWSMFWYDPTVSGAFWDGTPLDHFFDNAFDQWASMRSSWTDQHALYVAIKAGRLQGHQTHNDLDVGDFVLDALGTRFAGELGSGDYRSLNYFSNDTQTSDRWLYYRKMTEGQNTILINQANQNVAANPTVRSDSSQTTQGSSTVFNAPKDSTAFWTADISSAYFSANSVKRGVRLLNTRKQVLLQDEIDAQAPVQWRMHTNATVSIDNGGTSATLKLDGQVLTVSMLNPPSGAAFTTSDAVRFPTDPQPPQPDQPNPNVKVLIISLPAGKYTLEVLFNPQWPGMSASDFVTPPSVPLDSWSLTSHN